MGVREEEVGGALQSAAQLPVCGWDSQKTRGRRHNRLLLPFYTRVRFCNSPPPSDIFADDPGVISILPWNRDQSAILSKSRSCMDAHTIRPRARANRVTIKKPRTR